VKAVRIPATRPSWNTGTFAVHVDRELVGYFMRFRSAWLWREHVAATTTAREVHIMRHGHVLNVWRRTPLEGI
jgi:hypothetical protein